MVKYTSTERNFILLYATYCREKWATWKPSVTRNFKQMLATLELTAKARREGYEIITVV
jgi:hypothetical protein